MQQAEIDRIQQQWIVAHTVGRCLHVGCGEKAIPGAINIDPNPGRERWRDFDIDVRYLPFPDGYFDSVVSSHVLNAIDGLDQAMWQMARVLKPGGIMAHVVPDWSVTPHRWSMHQPWEQQHVGWETVEGLRWWAERYSSVLRVEVCEPFPEFHWAFRLKAIRL